MSKGHIRQRMKLLAGFSLIVGMAGCSMSGPPTSSSAASSMEEMKAITITLPSDEPETSHYGRALLNFVDTVEEGSDGKITFEVYPSGSLVKSAELLPFVSSNDTAMARVYPNSYPQDLPVSYWLFGLGHMASESFPHGMFQAAGVANELAHELEPLLQEFERHNVVPLMSSANSSNNDLLCAKEVSSVEDLKGLRVRTAGAIPWNGEVKALGMVPVEMAFLEVYEGLQRGVIDCIQSYPAAYANYGLWEVAKHYVPVNLSNFSNGPFLVNKDLWDSLPEDAQTLLHDAAQNMWIDVADEFAKSSVKFAEESEEMGVTWVNMPEANQKLAQYHETVTAKGAAAAAPAVVSDPQAIISEAEQLHAKWLELLVESGLPVSEKDASSLKESYLNYRNLDISEFREKALEMSPDTVK